MTGAEYIVEVLCQKGVSDAFGIPGGVLLDLIYAFHEHSDIEVHLNYHEQMSTYAAVGYAQASGKLAVTYATRGPGVTNMMTAIAEAYCESIPVLFLSAHTGKENTKQRFVLDQEIDLTESIKYYSKFSRRINTVEELTKYLNVACELAVSGRKGPVFLDIHTSVFKSEIIDSCSNNTKKVVKNDKNACEYISSKLKTSKRPIILIGDGIRHANVNKEINDFASKNLIPILSSRGAQDLISWGEMYYGYIGSHGIRYSNFILSKADLIICFGNRLSFPISSESYKRIYQNAEFIRVDIDEDELDRNIPNSSSFYSDVSAIKEDLSGIVHDPYSEWISVCNEIKKSLLNNDISFNTQKVVDFLYRINGPVSLVGDVGNNEFLVSRAYEYVRPGCPFYFSKSFGTLGVGIGRAIGVYYSTKKPVICFMGDQGFQYNSQELQYIAQWNLPISVVILNNSVSAMIRDKELLKYDYPLQTTGNTGYKTPDFKRLASAYGIEYIEFKDEPLSRNLDFKSPHVIEMILDSEEEMVPNLPIGNLCQDMKPLLDRAEFDRLNDL